jgi:hypothetical protein
MCLVISRCSPADHLDVLDHPAIAVVSIGLSALAPAQRAGAQRLRALAHCAGWQWSGIGVKREWTARVRDAIDPMWKSGVPPVRVQSWLNPLLPQEMPLARLLTSCPNEITPVRATDHDYPAGDSTDIGGI